MLASYIPVRRAMNVDPLTALRCDANGNAYVVGTTQSPNFPTTAGAFRTTGAASNFGDVFVAKLNATGTALVYSTFIGGSNFDWGRAIAIDAAGNAYVTGQTKSSNFPTTGGAFDRTFNVDTCPRCGIDQEDAFALKLNAAGSGLVYSTFLGGFDLLRTRRANRALRASVALVAFRPCRANRENERCDSLAFVFVIVVAPRGFALH
jgi:hypothetical protein